MLAQRLPTILPQMTEEEALEVTAIHSIAGLLGASDGLLGARPFRAPHHSLSPAALLGGGSPIRPGEVSLAHQGCLFLDELPEFPRPLVEGMRQPLEDGRVTISRARHSATFPARPLLLAAANPCPCGYFDIFGAQPCRCGIDRVRRYRSRLSGPLLDRIDLHIALPPVAFDELESASPGEASEALRARVMAARARQRDRHAAAITGTPCNASLSGADLDRVALPSAKARQLVRQAFDRLGMTARGYVRIRRVARTIADLDGSDAVTVEHFAEAVAARPFDRAATVLALAS